jgi:hypothetical protein
MKDQDLHLDHSRVDIDRKEVSIEVQEETTVDHHLHVVIILLQDSFKEKIRKIEEAEENSAPANPTLKKAIKKF